MASHETLLAELSLVNSMSTEDRLNHASSRRSEQVRKWNEYDQKQSQNNNHTKLSNKEPRKSVKFGDSITLLEAAARCDYDEVQHLLKNNVKPNEANDDGLTALHQACIDNFEDIVEVLLEHGADVNALDSESWTPLHAACTCGHTNIAELLVKHGANLLALNADNNMPYDICEEEDTLQYIESVMAQNGITQEQINTARSAKEQMILKEVTASHARGENIAQQDSTGATVLHVAAANGYVDLTRFFLLRTSDPNIQDNDGWTPLHAAACWCQIEVAEILGLEYNANPSIKNNLGETPEDVTEDEEIKALLAKLRTQLKDSKKKKLLFRRSNGRPTSQRLSGIRGQSFKRMSKRDKKNGISALEAKAEAQFWTGSQEPETNMLPDSPDSSPPESPHVVTKEKQDCERNAEQQPDPTGNGTSTNSESGDRSTGDDSETKLVKFSAPVNSNKSRPNGVNSKESGQTLADLKRLRAEKSGKKLSGAVGDPLANDTRKAELYGTSRKKKRSCVIL